ncbi:MAG: (2Fe-2S)-binding protein [Desulfurococcales archaeon]|nr:(2Fe-2S)-binding protein [Desulfurococcales archaeon]
MKVPIEFTLNGEKVRIEVEPNELLLNVLRDKLGVTSPKYVCGIGECGACTVLVDDEPVLSCLTLAVDVDGKEVVTAEGLAREGELSVVQKAFIEEAGVQCGYCTPGFVIMIDKLLRENPNPTEEEIRQYIRGNLCRCTGYVNIVKAALKAAEEFKARSAKVEKK